MKRRFLIHLFLALGLAVGFSSQSAFAQAEPVSGKVTAAVAASMRFAFEDIAKAFRAKQPNVEIVVTYGASGSFFAQLQQRAPFDLFLSADTEYPDKLVANHLGEACFLYAVGRLVLWAPKTAGLNVAGRGMDSLTDPRVIKISIANPGVAPYGRAAETVIKRAGLEAAVAPKLVRAENISQAVQFVQSGAAQIGFTAYSLTRSEELRDSGDFWIVPEKDHAPIQQSGVVIPWSKNRKAAEALREFILSAEGRAVLERNGFGVPRS